MILLFFADLDIKLDKFDKYLKPKMWIKLGGKKLTKIQEKNLT